MGGVWDWFPRFLEAMLQGRLGRNEEDLPACPWSAELATSPRWIPETSIVQGTRKVKGKNGPGAQLGRQWIEVFVVAQLDANVVLLVELRSRALG